MRENDLVEAIVGLPVDMFYNTGISTYVWILSKQEACPSARMCSLSTPAALQEDAEVAWQQAQGDVRRANRNCHQALRRVRRAELTTVFDAEGKELSRWVVPAGGGAPDVPAGGKGDRRCRYRGFSGTRTSATPRLLWSVRCATSRDRWCWGQRQAEGQTAGR
ncbi:hypothetical protein BZM27_53235 [Paraburkholderia steynii]|uniref:DNA methylase adenine-specific domain-containing protein n=1 Tax=Paraburkholderia steynii TaxID=1245441 RepID=A0A4V6N9B8_9BURK|nr:hypothetical protein BZM27_53235 [Paraburkholderia steynii]